MINAGSHFTRSSSQNVNVEQGTTDSGGGGAEDTVVERRVFRWKYTFKDQVTEMPREQVAYVDNTLVTSVKASNNEGVGPSNRENEARTLITWKDIGHAVSYVFRGAPICRTMVGPTNTELKLRQNVDRAKLGYNRLLKEVVNNLLNPAGQNLRISEDAQLEDGQVRLQSRLGEEEAKAALMGRIQRLTKLILVSTKASQSSRVPQRPGMRRSHSFGEEQLDYLSHRKKDLILDDRNRDLYVSVDGNAETLDEKLREEKRIKKNELLSWLKLKKRDSGIGSGVISTSSPSTPQGRANIDMDARHSSSLLTESNPSVHHFSDGILNRDLFETDDEFSGEDTHLASIKNTDEIDLLTEQHKILTGEVALHMSVLKRLSEEAIQNPTKEHIQVEIKKLKDEIRKKHSQISSLGKEIADTIPQDEKDTVEESQTVAQLMTSLNEKSFELEGIFVEGVKEESVLSHALSLIAAGKEHRHVGLTNFYLQSRSRSHTIFTLNIEADSLSPSANSIESGEVVPVDEIRKACPGSSLEVPGADVDDIPSFKEPFFKHVVHNFALKEMKNIALARRQSGSDCLAFVIADAVHTAFVLSNKNAELPPPLSPREFSTYFWSMNFVSRATRVGADELKWEGNFVLNAFSYIKKYGLCCEEEMPYGPEMNVRKDVPPPKTKRYFIMDFSTVRTKNTKKLKKYLTAKGPFIIELPGDPDFNKYTDGIYKGLSDTYMEDNKYSKEPVKKLGSHVAIILGWGRDEDGKNFFLGKNSWGTRWGFKGYFKISADEVKKRRLTTCSGGYISEE